MDGSIPPRRAADDYTPTDDLRKRVRRLAMVGVAHSKIASDLGLSPGMLQKHYGKELEKGDLESIAAVSGALFRNAVENNNVIAQIFYLKSRHGWVDRRDVHHNVTVGPQLTYEERLALLEAAPSEGPKGMKFLEGVLQESRVTDVTDEEDPSSTAAKPEDGEE